MKSLVLSIALLFSSLAFSQSKEEVEVLANARLVHQSVFVTKDSASLERLFSDKLSYGHSGGKLESKREAIQGITRNGSTYTDASLSSTSIWMEDKTAVTRYVFTATEVTKEGESKPLKLHIMLVWTKEKKNWKLLARQAVRLS